jgi:hypothetical protein
MARLSRKKISGIGRSPESIRVVELIFAARVIHGLMRLPLLQRKLVARVGAAAELLTRLNFNLKHGNFELDHEDGEIRFKTSHFTQSQPMTPEAMEHLIFNNLALVDTYYEVIMNVLHAGMTPQRALARHNTKSQSKPTKHQPRFEVN